jgi:hypothetical protein
MQGTQSGTEQRLQTLIAVQCSSQNPEGRHLPPPDRPAAGTVYASLPDTIRLLTLY